MVLAQQARQEVVVNELTIMKECRHENIVNFMDAYLHQGSLWVRYKIDRYIRYDS